MIIRCQYGCGCHRRSAWTVTIHCKPVKGLVASGDQNICGVHLHRYLKTRSMMPLFAVATVVPFVKGEEN